MFRQKWPLRAALFCVAGSATIALTAAAAPAVPVAGQPAAGRPAFAFGLPALASVTVRAWGNNSSGQLGKGTTGGHNASPVKVRVPAGTTVKSLRAGCGHSLALTATGGVLAWGAGLRGQLGNGSKATKNTPVKVKLPKGTKVTAIRAGCEHSLALTAAGHVFAWGLNALGELGTGGSRGSLVPVRVKLPKGTVVKAISAGCDHNLALTRAGKVYAWGYNFNGQLGNGGNADRHTPVRVHLPPGVTATLIAAGCNHSFAVGSGGTLYGWGRNDSGQLGNGTRMDSNVPVPINIILGPRAWPIRAALPGSAPHPGPAANPKLISVFAGCNHTLALWSNGTLLSWGDDSFGQLGDGHTGGFSDVPVSVQYPSGDHIKAVSAGCTHSLALTSTGQVLSWGDNDFGELGIGAPGNHDRPVPVALPSGRTATALGSGPGAQHSFAIVH